jgi:hypothetical protein
MASRLSCPVLPINSPGNVLLHLTPSSTQTRQQQVPLVSAKQQLAKQPKALVAGARHGRCWALLQGRGARRAPLGARRLWRSRPAAAAAEQCHRVPGQVLAVLQRWMAPGQGHLVRRAHRRRPRRQRYGPIFTSPRACLPLLSICCSTYPVFWAMWLILCRVLVLNLCQAVRAGSSTRTSTPSRP